MDALLSTLPVSNQVVRRYDVTLLLRLAFIGTLEMPLSRHLRLTTILTIRVERLMT